MAKTTRKSAEFKSKKQTILLFIFPIFLISTLLIILSVISVYSDLQKPSNYTVLLATIAFGSFVSGFLLGKIKRQQGIITGIIYILPTILIYAIISLILNSFSFDINLLVSMVVSIIAAAVGGIVGVNMKQNAKRVKK